MQFLQDIWFDALLFSADSTMNIGSRRTRPEPPIASDDVCAEHNYGEMVNGC
jgi:hypothetical protein